MSKREQRPIFHLTPPRGWINDPNGFSLRDGEYHMYYQHNPKSSYWGPPYWGHAVSRDLLTWEHLKDAMAPDKKYDRGGCFSGQTVELPDGRVMAMYTGNVFEDDDMKKPGIQTQCIAFEQEGIFEKYQGNPVIDVGCAPAGTDKGQFRDPDIWQGSDGVYRSIIACRNEKRGPQLLMYKSLDGIKWEFAKVFLEGVPGTGWMWECPDLIRLDGGTEARDVILVSSIGDEERDIENSKRSLAFIGRYREESESFTLERVNRLDKGIDFYAPQAVTTADGRKVMIGWMQHPDTANDRDDERGYFGQLSLPRELYIKEGKLMQRPAKELEDRWCEKAEYTDVAISDETITLEGVRGREVDMTVRVRPGEVNPMEEFRIAWAKDEKYETVLTYRPEGSRLTIDRSKSSEDHTKIDRREAVIIGNHLVGQSKEIKLRLILDRNSAEIFIGDGEEVMSVTFYTRCEAESIEFRSKGKAIMDVAKYRIKEK